MRGVEIDLVPGDDWVLAAEHGGLWNFVALGTCANQVQVISPARAKLGIAICLPAASHPSQ